MFPSNDFIDSFRQKIFSEIQDEKERRFSCYGIAQLYFQVEGYELAQKYVTEYLMVQHESAAAHKFLGQCYETLGQKESALETFKRSLQLDEKQDDLVLKICELLVNPDVNADFSQFLYWTERAESKYPDNPVVLESKKILITNNKAGDSDLSEIKTEISMRPSETVLTKMKDHMNSDSSFWIFLITTSERYVALALADDEDKAKIHSGNVLLNDQLRTRHNMHVFNRLLSLFSTEDHLSNVTCLHLAVMKSDPEMTRVLLQHGATIIDDPNFFKITSIAVKKGCAEIVGVFLDHGLNVADFSSGGETLLSSCLRDDIDSDFGYDTIKLLLEKGAAFYIQTPGNSLVFDAIKNKHHKIAHLFLAYNANVEYIGPDNDTVLLRAVQDKIGIEFINKLLKLNVAVDAANNKGQTPLIAACQDLFKDDLEIVKTLVHYGANINCTDDDLRTPLHFACRHRNLEMVTVLVEKGANTNAKNKCGLTPLHYTCGYGIFNTLQNIQLLLQYGANIEAVDNEGRTPLFVAVNTGNDIAVQCLLENNANVNYADLRNLTPFFMATQKSYFQAKIVEILLDHEINIHCVDEFGDSEVHNIVNGGQEQFIRSLSHTLVDFNSLNEAGNTPLHIAVKKNLLEMTKNLIKYGSDINILDSDDDTPLQMAINIIYSFRVGGSRRLTRTLVSPNQKKLIKILKTQVVKLKVAGMNVHDHNLNIVYGSDDDTTDYLRDFDEDHADEEVPKLNIQELEVNCEQEIDAMKVESIGNTGMTDNITFFDLLKKDIHYLSELAENENIEENLELEVYDEKFPMYINIVRNRFREAKLRCRLIDVPLPYLVIKAMKS